MDNFQRQASIYPFCHRTYTSKSLLLFVILSASMFSGQAIYENPPPYFNSFYCNLGTKTMAQSGTYSCTSPKVIEKADKFALSLVEFNKQPSVNIWFEAQVTSTPGTNLTSVMIRLEFKTAYTTRYGYMVVVIGYQPENTWLDLINVKLPQNSADSYVSMTPNPNNSNYKILNRVFGFPSSETFLSSYSHNIIFTTSFGIQTTTSSAYLNLHHQTGSATSLTITISTLSQNTIKTIFWGVLVFNQPAMPSSTAYKLLSVNKIYRNLTYTFNLHTNDLKLYGPPFNTKCLIGYLRWNTQSSNDGTITLLNSTNNNYFQTHTSLDSYILKSIRFNFFCIANTGSHFRGDFDEYFDPLTGQYHVDASQCPVPSTASSQQQCQNCSQIQCIDCNVSNRSLCHECIATDNIYLLGNGYCKRCSQIDSNCIECSPNYDNSSLVCDKCSQGYGLDSLKTVCIYCSSEIPDCLECFENSTTSNVQCTSCSQKFLVDQNFRCESCKVGIYYQSECYYLPGCSSFFFIDSHLKCLGCTLANFQFNQKAGKCVCQKGFIFNAINETCSGKCGDGIKVLSQQCDDGNLIIGDGCNDNCQQQENFVCSEDSSSKTKCIFNGNINITLLSILKIQNSNKAQISFKINPAPTSLYLVDWQKTKTLTFNLNETVMKPIEYFSYNQGILVVTLLYFNDIEGTTCIAKVKFDQSIIQSRPSFTYFQLKGQNDQLIYQNQNIISSQKVVSIASYAVGILGLVCFMISTWYHKIIGLETLQFIQLIYFTRIIFTGDSQSTVMAFNSLKLSNGFNEINLSGQDSQASLNSMHSMFQTINMRIYYLENCNLMLIPMLLGNFIFFWYKICSYNAKQNYRRTKVLLQKDKYLSFDRKATLVYDRLIFPYSMGILYLTIFQMLIYAWSDLSNQSNSDPLYVAISFGLSLAILLNIFFIFCSQTIEGIKNFFNEFRNKKNNSSEEKALQDRYQNDYHPSYVPFYLYYQIFLLVLMSSAILEFKYLTEVMMTLILVYSMVFFFWQPYTLRIHNISNIFNQGVVLSFLTVSILGKYNLLNDTLKIISIYMTIVLIVAALMLQMIRVYVYKKSIKQQFKVENNKIKQKPEQLKLQILENPYTLQNQLASQIRDHRLNIKFDNSKKIKKDELLEKSKEISFIHEQIQQKKNSSMVQIIKEDSKEYLKRLKKFPRTGLNPHQNRIFR